MNTKLTMNTTQLRKYEAGDVLVHKGRQDPRLFIIVSGSAAVYDGDPAISECLATLETGNFFGETGLFLGKISEVTVAALTDLLVLMFTKSDIDELFTKQPGSAFELIGELCERNNKLTERLHRFKAAFTEEQRRLFLAETAGGLVPPPITPRPPRSKPAPGGTKAPAAPKPTEPAAAAPPSMPGRASPAAVNSPRLSGGAAAIPAKAAAPASNPTPPPETAALSSLFPAGHKRYGGVIKPHDKEYLRDKNMNCPLCRTGFHILVPRASKLITESKDPDTRIRFRVIEPMYYEICTCPNCLYSALTELFPGGFASRAAMIRDRLEPYRSELTLGQGYETDMDSIFASYYLALQCAQPCFDAHLNIIAMLHLKISRLYADCKDETMASHANNEALKAYQAVYDNANVSGEKAQRLYISIGECALAAHDLALAKRFFYMAKVEKYASAALKEHADRRIEDIRS